MSSWPARARAALRAHPLDAFGCALAWLYGLPSLWYPFGSDQGIHWYLGHRLLSGDMPYASGISGKPPVIFAIHASAELLFGNRQSSIRVLELLCMVPFGWLLARAVRRPGAAQQPGRSDGEVGAAALLLSAANYTYQDYWNTAHPEFWMSMVLMAAVVVALQRDASGHRGLWVGALCMVAFMLKYPAAAVALPIAACAGVRALRSALPAPSPAHPAAHTWLGALPAVRAGALAVVREAGWFLLGAGLVFAACVLPFALTGTLRQMIEVCIDMTENYAGAAKLSPDWWFALVRLSAQGTFFLGTSALFVLGLLRVAIARRGAELAFAGFGLLLALASIASVLLQKRLFVYHWLAAYPFMLWLAFWALRQLWAGRGVFVLASALALTAAAFDHQPAFVTRSPRNYASHVRDWYELMRGVKTAQALQLGYHRKSEADRFGDLVRASEVVKKLARPGDRLCLTSFISPIYQLTGMQCSTRHAVGSFVPLGPPSWAREYEQDLRERPPRFMVSIRNYSKTNQRLIKAGYRQIARFGTVVVLDRLDAAATPRLDP
jgi:hypothetical protein